jgi:signal transduction histidine kinase
VSGAAPRPPSSLAWQLAAGLALLMAAVLLAFSLLLYAAAHRYLFDGLDRHLHRDAEVAQQAIETDPTGALRWREIVHSADDAFDTEPFVEAWSAGGRLLLRRVPPGGAATLPTLAAPADDGPGSYRSVGEGALAWRVGVERFEPAPGVAAATALPAGTRLRVARPEAPLRQQLAALAGGLAAATLLLSFAAGGLAWVFVRRVLAPLAAVARRLAEVGVGGRPVAGALETGRPGTGAAPLAPLEPPIAPGSREVAALAAGFDTMVARLSVSVRQIERFAADCAHALRTPLAALKLRGEQQLHALPPGEARAAMGEMLEAADRMTLLVNRLLALARAEGGGANTVRLEAVDATTLAREAADTMRPVAEASGRHLFGPPAGAAPVLVIADRLWLAQMLLDLLHNAVKFGPEGRAVTLAVHAAGPARARDAAAPARLVVTDEGPGLPPEVLARLGARADSATPAARRPASPGSGSGLGLAIVSRLARLQGGELRAGRTAEGRTEVAIHLAAP